LSISEEAYNLVKDDGYMLNNQAYVAYQQMNYQRVDTLLSLIRSSCNNDIVLLCADVLEMKMSQRTNEGVDFFRAKRSAENRIRRINAHSLNETDRQFFLYASSELHIITSTYYFYQEHYPEARSEIAKVASLGLEKKDMAQWIYYNYMLGSGGLVEETNEQKRILIEFDHLITAYLFSHEFDYIYFEANSLQSLASLLEEHQDVIKVHRPDDYTLLQARHTSSKDDDLTLMLASKAISLFQQYRDLFQTACAYRSRGELLFSRGKYESALEDFSLALHCVNIHHKRYYGEIDTLQLFDPLMPEISVEEKWLKDSVVQTVPDWIAGIRQQISLTYSALGDKTSSDFNRNAYLDILENTNQNEEYGARKQELTTRNRVLQYRLLTVILLAIALIVLAFIYRRRVHQRSSYLRSRLKRLKSNEEIPDDIVKLNNTISELEESLEVTRFALSSNKVSNIESRAKVSLVHSIVPYIDRIKGEIIRMKRNGIADSKRKAYVVELTDEIEAYNDVLTEWIKMKQGDLSLHISTVSLGQLFAVISEGHYAFDQKGVQLIVNNTSARVKADEALTLFMINTLTDNARKYTPRGGSVTLSAKESDEYVEIQVCDTGEGLSEEDVNTINNNKVYNPHNIGVDSKGKKGFGYGLMNCRGIIEKYKKRSSIFNCCSFGVQSTKGEGSTFFFRLPRVLMLLFAFLSSQLHADPVALYDSVYVCNLEGRYNQAFVYGEQALKEISPKLILFPSKKNTIPYEIASYSKNGSLDYSLLMGLRNELALTALALNTWEIYDYNNRIYTQLQKYANQDETLPEYCKRLEEAHRNGRILFGLIILFTLISLYLIYKLFINSQLEDNEDVVQEIDSILLNQRQEGENRVQQVTDELARNRFEENRLYVQNQVLDNCLSTIKHESMYYPSRIRQLAENMGNEDISQMEELVNYYRKVFTILSSQADEQVEQPGFKRQILDMNVIHSIAQKSIVRLQQKYELTYEITKQSLSANVLGDTILLESLFDNIFKYMSRKAHKLIISADDRGSVVDVSIQDPDTFPSEQEIHDMFYPSIERIPLLIAKQVIREHDTYCGNPGLRLFADKSDSGYAIHFTLLKYIIKE